MWLPKKEEYYGPSCRIRERNKESFCNEEAHVFGIHRFGESLRYDMETWYHPGYARSGARGIL